MDSLLLQTDSLTSSTLPSAGAAVMTNLWFWIALAECVLIVLLWLRLRYMGSARFRQKKDALQGEIDFGNVLDSAFLADPLYRELARKCHPDRFAPDTERMALADELFQQLSKNRNNIRELRRIKTEIQTKLGV